MLNIKDGTIVILNSGNKHIAKNNQIYSVDTGVCYNDFKLYDNNGKWPVKDSFYRQFDISNLYDLIQAGLVERVEE